MKIFAPKIRSMVAVYAPMQSLRTKPSCYMELAQAERLVSLGLATANKGNSIRMKALKPDPEIRGLSCKVGPRIMDAIAQQMPWAKAIQAGWCHA